MASRSQVEVNERRLRPIYDCLDSGYNKKAIQEVDKLLKKNKSFLCAKALKALALLRLGRTDESETILTDIHSRSPSDENVLHAMSICYKETYQWRAIADMYENAHKMHPDNEDVLSALFMAYVRLGDYKKQQHTAMVLHKLQPTKNPYYFWAIMSIVMQARDADEKLSRTMFLPLAERMALVYVKGDKVNSEAEVQLYLIILEMLGKKEEMIKVVSGSLGEKIMSDGNGRMRQLAKLHSDLEQWPQAQLQYKALLNAYADDWSHWQQYLASTMHIIQLDWQPQNSPDIDSSDVDDTWEKVNAFIEKHRDRTKRPLRGPHLAQMELMRLTTCSENDTPPAAGRLIDSIAAFFEKFGDKPTFFSDICPFLSLLSDCDKKELSDTLHARLNLQNNAGDPLYIEDVKEMQRHINVLFLSRCCSCGPASLDQVLAASRDLYSRFIRGLTLGKKLLPTDLQYSDSYLLLAVHHLIDAWRQTENTKYLWDAVLCLEKGRERSAYNSQFIILLMHLYSRLGVFGPCSSLYARLEVKHIIHDTLGFVHGIAIAAREGNFCQCSYIVFNNATRLGHLSTASTLHSTMMSFFTVNDKEIPEHLILAYKYGSFHKVNEFIKLRERLRNSLQHAQVSVELLLLEIILETNSHKNTEQVVAHMEIDPAADKIAWDQLRDNRDLTVIVNPQPDHQSNMEKIKQKSFGEEVSWLRLRSLTLRLIAACLRLPGHAHNCCSNGVSHNHADDDQSHAASQPVHETVAELLAQYTQHLHTECSQYSKPSDYTCYGPFRTRLSTFLSSHHSRVFTLLVELITYIHSTTSGDAFKTIAASEEKMQSVVVLLNEMVDACSGEVRTMADGQVTIDAHMLENYVQLTETLSHVVLLTGVIHRMLKPLKVALSKQGKKKKPAILKLPETMDNYSALCEGIESCTKRLHQRIKTTDPVLLGLDLSALKIVASAGDDCNNQGTWSDIWHDVETSLQQSSQQLASVLHHKVIYIESLKL